MMLVMHMLMMLMVMVVMLMNDCDAEGGEDHGCYYFQYYVDGDNVCDEMMFINI